MESILGFSLTQNVSDLHLSSYEKVIIRQNGQLIRVSDNEFSENELQKKLFSILTVNQQENLEKNKQIDFAYYHEKFGRFRVNVFYQKSGISAVFRIIKSTIPTLEQISAPDILKKLAFEKQGLILITGATGSGKSTTLAAILEYINQNGSKHIIALEDPIEFIYQNKKSLIQQREIGVHCTEFSHGLNSILRQDPDIIMIGELRNKETIETALQAAETGHLVFATLHTNSAIKTINRIVDIFPDESRNFIRTQLASSLQAIVSQKLIEDKALGRKAIFEVLINIPAVSHLIEEGKIKQLTSVMQTGQQHGMQILS